MSRCPSPTRSTFGTLRCPLQDARCDYPSHRKWRRVRWLMEWAWLLKPWWPRGPQPERTKSR